jgi:signal transduction histidine kinase
MGYNSGVPGPAAAGETALSQGGEMSVYAAGHPGQSHGTIRDEETTQFRLFVLAIVTVNTGLLFLAAQMGQPTLRPAELVVWVVFVAIAGFVPLNSGRGPSLAMDLPLLLAAAFVFGPLVSGVIALLGAVDIREVRREISWSRALWNRSQTSISVMCASVVFAELAQLGDWPLTPLVALVALGVDVTVNYAIVGFGTSLRTGRSFLDSVRGMRFGSPVAFIVSYMCFGFLGILIAEAYARFGLSGVVAFVAPVILGKQLFLHRSRLDNVEQALEVNNAALSHVDERIAAERQQERAHIAAALHDEVLQDLYNVTIRAQVLRQDLLSGRLLDLEDDLPAVIHASEAAVEDLREVIHGLRSAAIGHAGLVETLSLFAHQMEEESGIQVVLSLDADVHSSPERELVVYQIAREALVNAIKHSKARTIWVSIRWEDDSLHAEIADDGRGFDPVGQMSRTHFGLSLMRERALEIGAELEIHSSPGSGTVVRLLFRP